MTEGVFSGNKFLERLRAKQELEELGITMNYTDIREAEKEPTVQLSQEGGTHADESETSMMLYIKPEIVNISKAVKDYHPLKGSGLTRDPENTSAGVYSKSGIYGDPTLATVEKGEAIVEALVRHIVDDIKELLLK